MASIERLTDRQVKNATKQLNDGGNLWLRPRREAKTWIFRYMLKGKSRVAGLGTYPDTSLADARAIASLYRKRLKKGIDPLDENIRLEDVAKAEAEKFTPTFTQAAARYILKKRHGWTNRKHAHQWISTLKTHAVDGIGSKPVTDITIEDIEKILQPIWLTKTETAKRVQNRIEKVLDWATAKKYRSGDNPARWRGHLSEIFPNPSAIKKANNNGEERHQKAMPYEKLPQFWENLNKKNGLSANALKLLILTGCRSGEVLQAQWAEVSLTDKAWTIPARRTKTSKEHRIPLTNPMIEILKSLPRSTEYLFPGQRGNNHLSDMAMLLVLRDMGYVKGGKFEAYVPHGFRSTFRDWAEEQTNFPRAIAEKALGHSLSSKVERAYQRGDLFEKRRKLMNAWSLFIVTKKKGNVVQIKKQA